MSLKNNKEKLFGFFLKKMLGIEKKDIPLPIRYKLYY